jgi:hypothetical protein
MSSGEYDACDVTLSIYYINTEKSWLLDYIDIEGTRFGSEI